MLNYNPMVLEMVEEFGKRYNLSREEKLHTDWAYALAAREVYKSHDSIGSLTSNSSSSSDLYIYYRDVVEMLSEDHENFMEEAKSMLSHIIRVMGVVKGVVA